MTSLQIAVLFFAQLAVFLITLRSRLRRTKDEPSPIQIKTLLKAPQSLIDLSFMILAATFYSLLAIHSLVISGRAPSPEMGSLLDVILILVIYLAPMLYAWASNKSSVAIAIGAAATLIILLLSPGGVFAMPYFPQAERGIALFYPQLLLFAIIAGSIFYIYGNPFSKGMDAKRKLLILTTVLSFGLLVLYTNGTQYYGFSIRHYNAPNIEDANAVKEYKRIKSTYSLAERAKIYRYAQEIASSDRYRQGFLSTQEYLYPSSNGFLFSSERLSVFEDPEFKGIFNPNFIDAEESRTINGNERYRGRDREPIQFVSEQTYQKARKVYLRDMYDRYDRLTDQQQKEYLYNRVLINHSLNDLKSGESDMNLPGLSVKERQKVYNNLRIYYAMEQRASLKSNLTKLFDYGSQLKFNFNTPAYESRSYEYTEAAIAYEAPVYSSASSDYFDNYQDVRDPSERRFLADLKSGKESENRVFPEYDSRYTEMLLSEHACLPREYEVYLAYKAYQDLALETVKSKKLKSFIKKYQKQSSPEMQQAFYDFLAHDTLGTKMKVFKSLEDIDLGVYAKSKDPSKVSYLLGKVYEQLTGNKRTNNMPIRPAMDLGMLDSLALDSLMPTLQKPRSFDDLVMDLIGHIESLPEQERMPRYAELEEFFITESSLDNFSLLFHPQFYTHFKDYSQLTAADQIIFLTVVKDPVNLALPELVALEEKELAESITAELDAISQLRADERETLLHLMAIDKYRGSGGASLSAFPSAILKAHVVNGNLALIFASIIWLPFYVLAALIGAFVSHKLVGRDLHLNVVASEDEINSEEHGLGTAVAFSGRESVINKLMRLAGRGWSTIAVVGRRGIGKSRVLYELLQGAGQRKPKVSVWINAPSQYSERDFVTTVLERFALKTEQTIATHLGAKPMSVRRAESSSALNVVIQFFICQVVFILLYAFIQTFVKSSDLMILWVPLIILDLLAVICLVFYLTKIQPVNLGNWLQKDRSHNPHAIFLYRETMSVLSILKKVSRSESNGGGVFSRLAPLQRVMFVLCWIISVSAFVAAVIMGIVMLVESRSGRYLWWPAIIAFALFIGSVVALAALYRAGETKANEEKGTSLMSLIAIYRNYAEAVVNRVRLGALGAVKENDRNVIICVDEIDKIVDIEETKSFVRKMKALFEVPGVYYYLSLAEDTLQALYMGTAEGKNEIDSSFDHVVHIAPMQVTKAADIAGKYMDNRSIVYEPAQSMALGFISYGVARDIFRRVDEAVSNEILAHGSGLKIIQSYYELQLQMAYNAFHIDKSTYSDLLEKKSNQSELLDTLLAQLLKDDLSHTRGRIVAQLLLLVKVGEILEKDAANIDALEKARDIGYRIPIDRLKDIYEELKAM